jgi:hypothetical protein
MRVARVFESFQTCEDAVHSFHAIPADAIPQDTAWYTNVFSELGLLKQAS